MGSQQSQTNPEVAQRQQNNKELQQIIDQLKINNEQQQQIIKELRENNKLLIKLIYNINHPHTSSDVFY